jgi:DNA-directed RNA polymerase subunit F
MYHISPSYFTDIRSVLINRLPTLSDDEIEVIIEIFLTSH